MSHSAEVIDISSLRPGDNSVSATHDYIQVRRQIWAKDIKPQVKLIALAIVEHMRAGDLSCFPSKQRLLKMVRMTERAFDAHYNEVKRLFVVEARPGKSSIFHARVEAVSMELLSLWPSRASYGAPPATSAGGYYCPPAESAPPPPADVAPTGVETPRIFGDAPPADVAGRRVIITSEKDNTPKAPLTAEPTPSVWLNAEGVPQVVNGKRVTLEKALAGKIDVDVFCEVAAPKVRGQADIWGTLIAEAVAFPAPVPAKRQRRVIPEAYSEDFEHFWKLYPRAVGKAEAFKSWQRLSLAQKRKAYSALKAQLPDLSARANDLRGNFCPHPSTWINGGRFDDEAQANGSAIGSRPKPEGVPDHVWKKIQEDEARAAAPK